MAVYPDWINCLKTNFFISLFIVVFYHFTHNKTNAHRQHFVRIVEIHARDFCDFLDSVRCSFVVDVEFLGSLGEVLIVLQVDLNVAIRSSCCGFLYEEVSAEILVCILSDSADRPARTAA